MSAAPEFSRPLTLDAAQRTREPLTLTANADERRALGDRFGLIALDSLTASLSLSVTGAVVTVTGRMQAKVTQACVATAEPVPAEIDEPLALRCVPVSELAADPDAEIELSEEDCDTVDYDGAVIDLGELVAQSLALALDPWPRRPDADAILRAAGVKSEEEAGAFGALAALRDKLAR